MNKKMQKQLLAIAYKTAKKKSRDPSTQNGALLAAQHGAKIFILATGVNNLPDGIEELAERKQSPEKYKWMEHAERNVIFQAAKQGIKTKGLMMVCPWAACSACARAIIQSGITLLITHKQACLCQKPHWQEEVELGRIMLKEAGVAVQIYDGKVEVNQVLHGGQLWDV